VNQAVVYVHLVVELVGSPRLRESNQFLDVLPGPQNLHNELQATEFENKASVTKLLLGGTN
jgi:hypothetical protein